MMRYTVGKSTHFAKFIACLGFVSSMAFAAAAQAQTWTRTHLDGIDYAFTNGVHAYRVDLDLVGVSITPRVSAYGEGKTPSAWAKAYGLELAINANFFSMTSIYDTCSIVVSNGTAWGSPWDDTNYAQIGFTSDGRVRWQEQISTAGKQPWMYNVVSGTPEIVANGAVVPGLDTGAACTAFGQCRNYRSRSAIGVDKNNKYMILATSDNDYSSGHTVSGIASTLVTLGAFYAVNMDGGGSAGIYFDGKMHGANKNTRNVAVNLGFDVKARPSYVCKSAEIDAPSTIFYDMSDSHWGLKYAKALKDSSITYGCGGTSDRPLFCPDCGVKRIQAALFLYRALKGKIAEHKPSSPTFSDVTIASVGEEGFIAVESLAKAKIASGYSSGTFVPENVLTRQEAAMLIAKAYIPNFNEHFAKSPTPSFTDVKPTDWSYAAIEALKRSCIASGTTPTQFSPINPIKRIEFAALLAKAAKLVSEPACSYPKECTNLGAESCSGTQLSHCYGYELVKAPCPAGTICKTNACVTADECSGSSSTCAGNNLKTCIDGKYALQTCPAGICENSRCVECRSTFAASCNDGILTRCQNGAIVTEYCPTGYTCQDNACVPKAVCTENAKKCEGDTLFACADGIWIAKTDCARSGQICQTDDCIDKPECNPDSAETLCDDKGNLKSCNASGKWTSAPCNAGLACVSGICTDPGTDPTNPGTDPTNPGTDPTNPGTDPSNPGTDPSNPGTDPTNPGTDPSNPGTDPANPGIDPANPGTNPDDKTPTTPDSDADAPGALVGDSGCSNNGSHPHVPWYFAFFIGSLAWLRRTRRSKSSR